MYSHFKVGGTQREALLQSNDYPSSDSAEGSGGNFFGFPQIVPHIQPHREAQALGMGSHSHKSLMVLGSGTRTGPLHHVLQCGVTPMGAGSIGWGREPGRGHSGSRRDREGKRKCPAELPFPLLSPPGLNPTLPTTPSHTDVLECDITMVLVGLGIGSHWPIPL